MAQQERAPPPARVSKRGESSGEEEDDSEEKKGRRKIEISFIENKSRRHITFSKRKAGIMKKAYELATLTGTQVLLLVASETGHVYTFATPKLQPLITNPEGKNLIQACLNAPDPTAPPEKTTPGPSYLAAELKQPKRESPPQPAAPSFYSGASATYPAGTTPASTADVKGTRTTAPLQPTHLPDLPSYSTPISGSSYPPQPSYPSPAPFTSPTQPPATSQSQGTASQYPYVTRSQAPQSHPSVPFSGGYGAFGQPAPRQFPQDTRHDESQ